MVYDLYFMKMQDFDIYGHLKNSLCMYREKAVIILVTTKTSKLMGFANQGPVVQS